MKEANSLSDKAFPSASWFQNTSSFLVDSAMRTPSGMNDSFPQVQEGLSAVSSLCELCQLRRVTLSKHLVSSKQESIEVQSGVVQDNSEAPSQLLDSLLGLLRPFFKAALQTNLSFYLFSRSAFFPSLPWSRNSLSQNLLLCFRICEPIIFEHCGHTVSPCLGPRILY